MKGRIILWETQGSSICALCPHRLGEVQAKASRRFLQTSRAVSKPPAAAAAVIEEESSARHYNESTLTASQNSWPLTGGKTILSGDTRKWTQPAFGNGSFARPQQSPTGWSGPTFGSATDELTEEERRVKELIAQAEPVPQRRLVNIYSGPGPQSTRAGRPIPPNISEAKRALLAREKAGERALNTSEQQRISMQSETKLHATTPPSQFRIVRHVSSKDDWQLPSRIRHHDASLLPREPTWSQLKRTNEPPRPVGLQDNSFVQGRAQREEFSKLAKYTPLGQQSGSGTWQSVFRDSQSKPSSRLKLDTHYNAEIERTKRAGLPMRPKAQDQYLESRSTNIPRNSTASSGRGKDLKQYPQHGEPSGNNLSNKVGQSVEDSTSQSRRQDMSWRGIDRDKRRRRESFVQKFNANESENPYDRDEGKQGRKREKAAKKAAKRAQAPTPLLLPEYISIANLASALRVRIDEFMCKLEELGFEAMSYDHILNGEHAALIAMEYNFEPVVDRGESEDLKARPSLKDKSQLPERPPIVTIMGHVDHGKTTLLDWLRKSSVAATEYGGITQHIGAFSVPMPSGKLVTFLDTPGHAAFLSMRQRGANVTDIVILVVAADDSVKPQTIEAINHAKAAKVPIIVAINKVDKEEANIERVKHDLARHGVEIEDFGGDTQVVCVSGKSGQGMNELEEAALTLSEILDLRAERDGPAEGWILEASIKSLGKVATVLVRRGTFRAGDFIVAGKTWARIRCLRNEAGAELTEASPGTPVEIDGWKELPLAGDEALQAPTESKAKSVVEYRLDQEGREKLANDIKSINDSRKNEQEKREREIQEASLTESKEPLSAPNIEPAGPKQIHFIVKGDVSGSVEAVVDSISCIGNKEVQPHILRFGVGQITEFDVEHAAAANGYLINFNTAVDPNISRLAYSSKVKILDHNIIYRLVNDVKETLSTYLPPLLTQRVLGEADVAQIFDITVKRRQHKAIAGCKIRNGTVSLHSKVRVLRNGVVVFDGQLASLKNVKKDVPVMRKGNECGMGFDGWDDFRIGDQVQCYETKEEKRYL